MNKMTNANGLPQNQAKNAESVAQPENIGSWEELSKLGEAGFHDDGEQEEVTSESAEEKQARVAELSDKISKLFYPAEETSGKQSGNTSTSHEPAAAEEPVAPLVKRQRPLQQFINNRKVKQLDRLANGNHNALGHSLRDDYAKVIKIVESGKADVHDPRVLQTYMEVKFAATEPRSGVYPRRGMVQNPKTIGEKVEDIIRLGVEAEKPVQMLAERMILAMNVSKDGDAKRSDNSNKKQFDLAYYDVDQSYVSDTGTNASVCSLDEMANLLQKYDLPGIRQQIATQADVQKFGNSVASFSLLKFARPASGMGQISHEKSLDESQGILRKRMDFLKSLGYEPFKGVEEQLFNRYNATARETQAVADKLGLLDGPTVDRMYEYKFNELNQAALAPSRSIPELYILPQLECSGQDKMASFWRKLSVQTGTDAMTEIAQKAVELGKVQKRQHSIFSYLANEYYHSSDKAQEPLSFFLANAELLSDPDRSMARMVAALARVDEQEAQQAELSPYDLEYDRQRREGTLGQIFEMRMKEPDRIEMLFDDTGLSRNGAEMAVFDSFTRKIASQLEPDWRRHFSPEFQANIIIGGYEGFREHPELLQELSVRRRKLAELHLQPEGDLLKVLDGANLSKYFGEDGEVLPALAEALSDTDNKLFQRDSLPQRRILLASSSELQQLLPADMQQYLDTLRNTSDSAWVSKLSEAEIAQFFTAKGPAAEFWQAEFKALDFDGLINYVKATAEPDNSDTGDENQLNFAKLDLTENQQEVLNIYRTIDPDIREDFKNFAGDKCEEIPKDRIRLIADVLMRLKMSNASELSAHRTAFAAQLLATNADDTEMFEDLARIEDVFVHNNLPFVGKVFLAFQTLHPVARLERDFNLTASDRISPTLKEAPNSASEATTTQGKVHNREAIIFNDLLKASFGSNNRSLRDYLQNLREGQTLLEQLASGEITWDNLQDGENIPVEVRRQRSVLQTFAQHLATMYNNLSANRDSHYELTGDLQTDVTNLVAKFAPTERHTLADRVVRSFAAFAGVKDLATAEQMLSAGAKRADARNRAAIEREVKLEPGDFVKGLGGVQYLSNIMQNGSVAREFLGDAADSDATPLDTDLSLVLRPADSLDQVIGNTAASGYGPIWVALKGDNNTGEARFSITRRSPVETDQTIEAPQPNGKLEAFYTGALGSDHYGIRTGFASSEIDFFIVQHGLIDESPAGQVVGLESALNGFYVPVIDRSDSKVIFSPDDYDKIRRKMSGLSFYQAGEYQFASEAELRTGETVVNGTRIPSISEIVTQLAQNEADVQRKHNVIDQAIDLALDDIGSSTESLSSEIGRLRRKNYIDGDLTEGVVELIDTGSTGRLDNIPGDGDFDYMMRVDKRILSDPAKVRAISNALLARFGKIDHDGDEVLSNGDLRLHDVYLEGLAEPVKIDISFRQKTNKVQYSTDMALEDMLKTMRQQSPERYQEAVANIIFAKKFCKAAGAYKPKRSPEESRGGLGGVGVENWVLQNGGSFLAAATEFMEIADKVPDFATFKARYAIWDFGENHMANNGKAHNNFVADNMDSEGYEKLKAALAQFLEEQKVEATI